MWLLNANANAIKYSGDISLSSNDVALFLKEWHFSDEWEQFSSKESISSETSELQDEEPLLNQAEIESLLNHYNLPKKQIVSGLEHLLEAKNSSYYNLAFLDNLLKNFSQECLNDWRSALLMSDNLEYFLQDKNFVSLKHYIDETLIKGVTRVIKSKQCESPIFINFSSECTHLLIESLLGGHQTTSSLQKNDKPLTKIENNISLHFIHTLIAALERAFSKLVKYEFYLEKKNNLTDLMSLSHFSDNALLVKFMLRINSSSNVINVLFPMPFLEDFKQKLERENEINRQPYTAIWQNYLAQGLEETNLAVDAKLPTMTFSLAEILNWKIGTRIILPLKPSSPISLECGGLELMKGEMGQRNNSVAIQIKRNKLTSLKEEE
ncbi:MAG: hypothetical protein BGO76_02795 [Caedibacter sp. 38-128]|mgnify:CR=1 FL=1|nr:MAG: hypothetical protein BGO76_02795 [Caedibacter sp. 38-128]